MKPGHDAGMQQDGPQQHDLRADVAMRLVRGAGVQRDERILDAGAGQGAITRELLAAGAQVTAVEADRRRVAGLQRDFATAITAGALTVVPGDLRRWHPRFSGPWRVVANPPFNLTAELVRRWLLDPDPPGGLDLILQRETAEKLTGRERSHSRSSALIRLAGMASVAAFLRRDATEPASRVDLAAWRFRRDGAIRSADLVVVDRLLEIAFAGPRTVSEALRGVATAIQVRRQAQEQGWDPRAHPREVPPQAWLPLARLLAACGKL